MRSQMETEDTAELESKASTAHNEKAGDGTATPKLDPRGHILRPQPTDDPLGMIDTVSPIPNVEYALIVYRSSELAFMVEIVRVDTSLLPRFLRVSIGYHIMINTKID